MENRKRHIELLAFQEANKAAEVRMMKRNIFNSVKTRDSASTKLKDVSHSRSEEKKATA